MIYVLLAHGFEELEAVAAIDIIRRAELDLKIVGVDGPFVRGSHGITLSADIVGDQLDEHPDEIPDAVVLPGGMPGTLNLEKSPIVQNLIDTAMKNGKLVAAICAAPSILGHKGILENRDATVFPGMETTLAGARLAEDFLVRDGNIITAKGPGIAVEFALEIVRYLEGDSLAKSIKDSLQCR